MKAENRILYLLTLYVHTLTADLVTSYQVNALNHIFTYPGWTDLSRVCEIKIVVQTPEDGSKLMTANDMLATGSVGQLVTKDNAEFKIRQMHQLLSCMYASLLETCYGYNINAITQCSKIDDPSDSLKCLIMCMDMIRDIDRLAWRMQGTLSCIYRLFPETAFEKDVSTAIEYFKTFYDNLNFDSESLDIEHHDTVVHSTAENMHTALRRFGRFYIKFCKPPLIIASNGQSKTTEAVEMLEAYFPDIDIVANVKLLVNTIVDENLNGINYLSLGFEYDSNSKTTRIMYDP